MKKLSLFMLLLFIVSIIAVNPVFAAWEKPDINLWSNMVDGGQSFEFNITSVYECAMVVANVNDQKSILPVEDLGGGKYRAKLVLVEKGDYYIHLKLHCKDHSTEKYHPFNYDYEVAVGDIFFLDHFRLKLANGNAGYTFIIYPLFGSQLPRRFEVEMTFDDIHKISSVNCALLPLYGYCETDIIEFSPEEYELLLGDVDTCITSDFTESCRSIRYYDFLPNQ